MSQHKLAGVMTVQPHWVPLSAREGTKVLTTLTREGHLKRALEVLHQMRRQLVQVDEVNYRCLLFGTAWQLEWLQALNLLESMHQNEITKNQGACHAAISACRSSWPQGVAVLKAMRRMQLRHEVTSYSNTANGFLSSLENWTLSLQTLQDLRCSGLEADDFCHSIAISTCRLSWPTSLQCVSCAMSNVVCVNAGISVLNEAKRWQHALKLMDSSCHSALKIDVMTFGALSGSQPHWTRSVNLLERMGHVRCEANTITLNAVISACEEAGAWQIALGILRQIRSPSQITWNACISSCAKADQWNTVLVLMDSMVEADFQPDVITFNAAIRAMAEQWPKALQLLRQMQLQRLHPTLMTYGTLISCCEKSRQWQKALGLLQEAKQHSADVICYSACISACEKARMGHLALELLAEMRREELRADGISCNAVLSSCEKSGDWQMALEMLQKIQAPVTVSFNACLSSVSVVSAWFSALALFQSMRKLQLQPDDVSYNAAITASSGKWSVALAFFQLIPSKDPVTFGAAISSCGRWNLPLALLMHLDHITLMPNQISYNAAVEACKAGFMWKEVLALRDMSSMWQLEDSCTELSMVAVLESCNKPQLATTALGSLEKHMEQTLKSP